MAFQTLEGILPGFSAAGQSASGQLVVLPAVVPTGIPASVAANVATITALTGVTGLLAADTLMQVTKAAGQAGLNVQPADNAQGGVTGDGAVTVRYINPTAGAIIPTASELYTFIVLRSGGTDGVTKLGAAPSTESQGSWLPFKCSLTSPTLVTGQATNFVTISFRAYTTAAVARTIATLAFSASTVTLPANVEVNVPITAGAVIQAGEFVDVLCAQTASGLALPPGIVAKVEIG